MTPSFYPAVGFGGPIYSTLGIRSAMLAEGIDWRVLTTDTAGAATGERLSEESMRAAGFGDSVVFARKTWGADFSIDFLRKLPSLIRWADVVHLSAVYSFPTLPTLLISRLFQRPVVWMLHGSLMTWDKTARPILKRLWRILCALLLDPQRTLIHATSEAEAAAASLAFPQLPVRVVPSGIAVQQPLPRTWRSGGVMHLMYLGRLDPIKGLENLLCALSDVTKTGLLRVHLTVHGSGTPAYETRLKQMAVAQGVQHLVTFAGQLKDHDKAQAFADADLLVLPSHSENFGMVVVEALSHGVPVLASNRTPWEKLETLGAGFWVSNSPGELSQAIYRAAAIDLEVMGKRGRAWVEQEFRWSRAAQALLGIYEQLREQR